MPAKLESLGPRSADGPLRTAVAKTIILPLWGRGHDKLESFGFWRRKFCIKNAEILSVGKIAEFAKFAGGKRRKSPDRFSLHILAEGGDVIEGRIVDIMLEPAEA